MKNWGPSDVIMLILASTVSLVLLIIFVISALTTEPMPEQSAKLVAGLIASIISIISMYIGAKIQKNKDN